MRSSLIVVSFVLAGSLALQSRVCAENDPVPIATSSPIVAADPIPVAVTSAGSSCCSSCCGTDAGLTETIDGYLKVKKVCLPCQTTCQLTVPGFCRPVTIYKVVQDHPAPLV